MVTLTPVGVMAKLEGDLPPGIDKWLEGEMLWFTPLDMNLTIAMYSDRVMYAGAMQDVCRKLHSKGIDCEINLGKLSKKQFDWHFNGQLRKLQPRLVEAGLKHRYGFLEAPCGVGKTVILSKIIADIGKPTVVLVQNELPFEQAYKTISSMTDIPVGRLGGGYRDVQSCTVCMVQTAKNRDRSANDAIKDLLKKARVIIIDEGHNAANRMYFEFIEECTAAEYLLAVSATPFRSDEKESLLYGLCGPVLARITMGEAIENGLLVPLSVFVDKLPKRDFGFFSSEERVSTYKRRAQYREVERGYILENHVRNGRIMDFVRFCIDQDLSCAIIVKRIQHGHEIAKLDPRIVEVYGPTKKEDREAIFSGLRDKRIMCIVTTLLDEAADIPSLSGVALAAGGKSRVKLYQRLRNTRKFSGQTAKGLFTKERALVYYPYDRADFVSNHSRMCLGYLQALVSEHQDNELIYI